NKEEIETNDVTLPHRIEQRDSTRP
ncbi:MAG TPA: catabolite control protein A, partial [Exiguobacterium sp.]|nr:catabolite control protein A [Exiguobacterium sp.]